jgi:hypothetical protein
MTADEFADALLHFASHEAEPRLRPDPYHLRQLAEQVRSAFSGRHLDDAFAGRLRRALYDGLCRLDALPRNDPFWVDTNRRPTLGKIRELAGQLLGRGTADAWACWAFAATSVLWCSNDFGLPGWRGLHTLGLLDMAWPVQAACRLRFDSGFDPGAALASFLVEVGACVAGRNTLEAAAVRCGDEPAGWARGVARRCPVFLDPAWLSWNGGLVGRLARSTRAERAWERLPILADALEEAGCETADLLGHLRGPGPHGRCCWIVAALLGED